MRTRDDLRRLQALPLELKIKMTQRRIRDWVKEYGEDGVYVSFSGGKEINKIYGEGFIKY